MNRICYMPSFTTALEKCRDKKLKTAVTERLQSFEHPLWQVQESDTLKYYTSEILVMKFFGDFNSRTILRKQIIHKIEFFFVTTFFDQSNYSYWYKKVLPMIASKEWEQKNSISEKEKQKAYIEYQQNLQSIAAQQRQTKHKAQQLDYVLDWLDQNWYRSLQYAT